MQITDICYLESKLKIVAGFLFSSSDVPYIHEAQIELYHFSKKRFIVQQISA